MFYRIKKFFIKRDHSSNRDIDPDEIFLDSKNLPNFNVYQFEGRIEKPISQTVFNFLVLFIFLVGGGFIYTI